LSAKYTRLGRWDPDEYEYLLNECLLNAATTWWLSVEIIRVANLVIDAVRAELDPLYRFHGGVVLMRKGDVIFGDTLFRIEYDESNFTRLAPIPTIRAINEK
jgi:hypothetical protein